jgi:hypothetical protein
MLFGCGVTFFGGGVTPFSCGVTPFSGSVTLLGSEVTLLQSAVMIPAHCRRDATVHRVNGPDVTRRWWCDAFQRRRDFFGAA